MLDLSQPIVTFGVVVFLVTLNRNEPPVPHKYTKDGKLSNLYILLGMTRALKSGTEQSGDFYTNGTSSKCPRAGKSPDNRCITCNVRSEMISKFVDNLWRPRRMKHHRRKKSAQAPIVATEKLEDRTLLSGQDLVAFAQALTAANVTLYGAAWDEDTTSQKSLFEDGAQFLQFVDVTNTDRTLNASAATVGINDIASLQPIWKDAGGALIPGIQSLQELSTATGIAIPISTDPFLKAIPDQDLLSGTGLHVALDGFDPESGPLTYTVDSSNPNISARILSGNRSIRISVEGYGDMVFELFEGRASRAAERIIELAENEFYKDIIFHRIVNNFVIQGGDPTGTGSGGSTLGFFDDQFHSELQHVQTGLISMAKTFDDTNDSQFFITEGPSRHLDFQHTIFGFLVEGEDVRQAISNVSVTGQTPNFTIKMENVDVFTDLENATLVLSASEGYTGTSTVTVTVEDQDGNTSQRQFQVNATPDTIIDIFDPANANPYLADIPAIQVSPGDTVQFQLEAIDVDLGAPNSNSSFVYLDQVLLADNELPIPVTAPVGLVYGVDNNNNGLVTVSPSASLPPGVYSITVAVGFYTGAIDYQVVTVSVTDPPVAQDDFFAFQGDTPGPVDILSNDTDSDGTIDPTTVEIVSQASHGTVTANPDGTINFVADGSGYMGFDSFSYRVKDNFGAYSNTATVNFTMAPAGVILVTTLDDLDTDDEFISLREAIIAANTDAAYNGSPAGNGLDTIMFDPSLFDDVPQVMTLEEGQFIISDSLSIIAPVSALGAPLLTLDANLGSRHFTIDDSTAGEIPVSLQNLKLINGQINGKGGSLFNAEELELKNSHLIDNTSNTLPVSTNMGGAIYNSGILNVSNSLIQSNASGLSAGGAIASESGSVTLTQTTIDDNLSEFSGGGIYAINSNVSLIDSTLSNNTNDATDGGGLYQVNGQLNITNSTIIGNTNGGTLNGGGIYASATTTIISGSTFHDNTSIGAGGGLYQVRGTLSIRDSTFSENSAVFGSGGGIFTGADSVSIVNTTISENDSGHSGGGIYFNDLVTFTSGTIDNSTIAGNGADQDGGGLYIPATAITLNNTIVADNSAAFDGTDILGSVNGSFSLVENTTGASILGTDFITGQDPGLLALSDNGGLTKTHALAPDSIAIDAGDPAFNPASFTPELAFDQRNSARVADGNHDSLLRLDIGAYEAQSVLGSVDLTVKWNSTSANGSGEVNALPANAEFLDEWNAVVVEIWVSITNSAENGVTGALVDFSFDAQYLIANSIEYGPGFTGNQTGNIDNVAGTITGLGATTGISDLGAETFVLLARIELAAKPVPLNAVGQYIQPVADLDFQISNSTLTSVLGGVAVTEGTAVNLTLVPALYDLNDSGVIDFADLVSVISVYNKNTGDPGADITWAADFDRSGKVDFRDLTLLISNYLKVQGNNSVFNYPDNFDEVWQQNNLITSLTHLVESNQPALTVETVEPVLDAARQKLAEVQGDSVYEKLADVEVKIVELPENQLAKAETDANTIYLDINAAGWGWFVDQTPLLNEEFDATTIAGLFEASLFSSAEGQIDLLTVLMHELNHLLGHDHDESLMESTLEPGERVLPEDHEYSATDDFFGSFLNSELPNIT